MIPDHRLARSGRTHHQPWDAGTVGPGAALERPLPRRWALDVLEGVCWAIGLGLLAAAFTAAMWWGNA